MTTRCMAWLASESSSTSSRWLRTASFHSASMARVASASTTRSRFLEGPVRFLWVEVEDTWVSDGTLLVTTFAPNEKVSHVRPPGSAAALVLSGRRTCSGLLYVRRVNCDV